MMASCCRNARFSTAKFDFDTNHVRNNIKAAFKNPISPPLPTVENFRCYPGLPGISNDANPAIEVRIEFSVGTRVKRITKADQSGNFGLVGNEAGDSSAHGFATDDQFVGFERFDNFNPCFTQDRFPVGWPRVLVSRRLTM